MPLEFKKPTEESKYLNGIIRHINVKVNATSTSSDKHNCTYIIGNDYTKYWHSKHDTTYSQYAQIDFINKYVFASSYMFYTGNNNDNNVPFYSPKWKLNCSYDTKSWHTIDTRSSEANSMNQKILLDMQSITPCRAIRIIIVGADSKGRGYAYIGPFELFGKVTSINKQTCARGRKTINTSYFFLIVIAKS